MDKSWENDSCSPLQLKKIRNLVEKLKGYEICINVLEIAKCMTHTIIDDIINGNLLKLIKAGGLRSVVTETTETASLKNELGLMHKLKDKVTEGGHHWNYTDFRLEAGGTLVDFAADDRTVLYQLIEVDLEIDPELIKK